MNRLRPLALALAVVLHGIACVLLVRATGLLWPLLAHLVGAALWTWGAGAWLQPTDRASRGLHATCALLFPVLGPLISVTFVRLLRRPPPDRSARAYLVWNDQAPDHTGDSLPSSASGQSIVEILQSPRTELRRNAILALRDLDPYVAIPLLRKGLQDSDEQVRIYSQNILSNMIERFETNLKDLEQRVQAEPAAALHALRLAEHYHELVYLDVAGDDETAAHYLTKAQTILSRAAALTPHDSQIPFLGMKCALRARDFPAAEQWFARLQAGAYDIAQVLPWRMELVFHSGDWVRLRELFTVFERAQLVNPRIDDLIRYWRPTPQRPPDAVA